MILKDWWTLFCNKRTVKAEEFKKDMLDWVIKNPEKAVDFILRQHAKNWVTPIDPRVGIL